MQYEKVISNSYSNTVQRGSPGHTACCCWHLLACSAQTVQYLWMGVKFSISHHLLGGISPLVVPCPSVSGWGHGVAVIEEKAISGLCEQRLPNGIA